MTLPASGEVRTTREQPAAPTRTPDALTPVFTPVPEEPDTAGTVARVAGFSLIGLGVGVELGGRGLGQAGLGAGVLDDHALQSQAQAQRRQADVGAQGRVGQQVDFTGRTQHGHGRHQRVAGHAGKPFPGLQGQSAAAARYLQALRTTILAGPGTVQVG